MRKFFYYAIFSVIILAFIFWLFFFSKWDIVFIDLIVINALFYILRKPIKALTAYILEKRIYQIIISTLYNIIWMIFVFWFILILSIDLFVAIVSFLVVAIAFTFRNIINNMASGTIMIATEQFEIGDIIETNNIQGRVEEIDLNSTRLREFDGVQVIIPNSSIFGSPLIKFTRKRYIISSKFREKEVDKFDKRYKRYINQFKNFVPKEVKFTKYVKEVEIKGSVNPEELDSLLGNVFDRYEPIFGIRPDYCIDMTRFGRIRILLYVMSNRAKIVLNFIDSFLRDVAYQLFNEEIFDGWEEYKKSLPKELPIKKENAK